MDETTMDGDLTQTGDHLLTGNSDISGDLDVDGNTTLDSTTVNEAFVADVTTFDVTATTSTSHAAPQASSITGVSADVSTEIAVNWVVGGTEYADGFDFEAAQSNITSGEAWIAAEKGAGTMFIDYGDEYNGYVHAADTLKLSTEDDGVISLYSDSVAIDATDIYMYADSVILLESDSLIAMEADSIAARSMVNTSYSLLHLEESTFIGMQADSLISMESDSVIDLDSDEYIFMSADSVIAMHSDSIIGLDSDEYIYMDADSMINMSSDYIYMDADSVDIYAPLVDMHSDSVWTSGTLTVEDFTQLNDSLNVKRSAHVQDNVTIEDSLFVNTAGNTGDVFQIMNDNGGKGVYATVMEATTAQPSGTVVLTTPQLIVEEQLTVEDDLDVGGDMTVDGRVTSTAEPLSAGHLANKYYVDQAVENANVPPAVWSYDAVESSIGADVIYYINGDLLMYEQGQDNGSYNYTIELQGTDLDSDHINGVKLMARGNEHDIFNSTTGTWNSMDGDDTKAQFNIGYSHITTIASGQLDGYVSCSLIIQDQYDNWRNSGLTIRFYLDSENAPADTSTFDGYSEEGDD
jgi:hypothetical protein